MRIRRLIPLFLIVFLVFSLIFLVYAAELFSDGFETGDFSGWDGTNGTPTIQTTYVHTGTYAMNGSYSVYAYESWSEITTVYLRVYVYFTALPSANYDYDYFFNLMNAASGAVCNVGLRHMTGSNYDFVIQYLYPSSTLVANTTTDPQINTWYSLELKFVKSATVGEYTFWLDGVQTSSTTSLDTSGAGTVNQIRVGAWFTAIAGQAYMDCVKVADAYIGTTCDTAGPETHSFSNFENFVIIDTVYKNMELSFQSTSIIMLSGTTFFWKAIDFESEATIMFATTATMQNAFNFLMTGTVNILDSISKGMSLSFQATDIIKLWDSGTAVFQIYGPATYTFIVDGLIKVWDNGGINKALQFTNTGTIKLWDSVSMLKSIVIRAFENFDPIHFYSDVSAVLPSAALTVDIAVAIGVLALVIAITSFGAIFLRRRQDF